MVGSPHLRLLRGLFSENYLLIFNKPGSYQTAVDSALTQMAVSRQSSPAIPTQAS